MSRVTDVVFLCSELDVEAWEAARPPQLLRVDQYSGGGRSFEQAMYAGAYNYLDDGALLMRIDGCEWLFPEALCLLTRDEDADTPTVRIGKRLLTWCAHGRHHGRECPLCAWLGMLDPAPDRVTLPS